MCRQLASLLAQPLRSAVQTGVLTHAFAVHLQRVFSLRFFIFDKRNEPCQKIQRAALQCSFGGSSMAHRKERESLDGPGQSLHADSNNHLWVLR